MVENMIFMVFGAEGAGEIGNPGEYFGCPAITELEIEGEKGE